MSDKIQRTELSEIGEFGLIEGLTRRFEVKQPSTTKGIGDDAAVISYEKEYSIVSTDMLIEGIHFDMAYSPLKHLGYKAVIVNLSDIYAMNATPKQITVSIAASNRFSAEALVELYAGVRTACEFYNVDLIGGDTTSSPSGLVISVTAIGSVKDKSKLAFRDGAKPGDIICVSGDLGAAYLGLLILEREKQVYLDAPTAQPELEQNKYLVERQLKPEARKDVIDLLAKAEVVPTSMIDISDGLASEIMHICNQSKTGALIEEANVPVHNETYEQAIEFKMDPITCALSGGEDYELLFTINPADLEKIKFMLDIKIIGEIVKPEEGIKLLTKGGNIHDIFAQGWRHFEGSEE